MPASNPSRSSRITLAVMVLVAIVLAHPAYAMTDDDIARLRDALRDAVSSLREAQDENAALTAKQAELTADLAAKQQALDALQAQLAASNAKAGDVADARAATSQADSQLTQTQTALKQWQEAYNKAVDIARSRDAAARAFEQHYAIASSGLKECSAKNDALEKLGAEMLPKIGRCSFGDFLGAHDAVTQIYRARLETLTDSYQDKLRDDSFPPK